MRFECDNCHAKYKISDQKVVGRVVRFPCRKCDNKILIDGRSDDVTVPAGPAYGFEDVTRRSEPAPFGIEPATARRRPVPSARRRQSSVPPRRSARPPRRMTSSPAAASSALVGQHPGLAPPLPSRSSSVAGSVLHANTDKPEWHVSINDVPVGPVRLEELAHKVDAGAVSEYSLVWRDGFDEWRPLATVPELMSLLYQRRSSGPPTRNRLSSMPPFVEAQTAIKDTADPPSISPGPPKPPVHSIGLSASGSGVSDFGSFAEPTARDASVPSIPAMFAEPPEMHTPFVPAPAATPAPAHESNSSASGAFSGLLQAPDEAVSIPAVPPQVVVAEPRTGTPAWVWILLVGVAAFAGVAAIMVVDRWGDSLMERFLAEETPIARPRAVAVPTEPEVPVDAMDAAADPDGESPSEADANDALPIEEGVAEASAGEFDGAEAEVEGAADPDAALEQDPEPVAEPPPTAAATASKASPTMKPAKPRRRARPRRAPKPAASTSATGIKKLGGDSLSADEQKVLSDFGSGKSSGVAKIAVAESGSTQSKRDPLDSKAVIATVTVNKPRLQRCYERAIRGQQSPDAVRMNVSLTVAASGRVADVQVAGSGPGGLKECVEASIRRWRFPVSSEGGPAKFPIVFSAN